MKIKINLSFLSMINKLEKDKLKGERLTALEWKVLIFGIGTLRNKLYKHIGTEKDETKINDFLRKKMTAEDREIELTRKHRKKYFNSIKPNVLYKNIEKLSRSEVVLLDTSEKKENANIITDRGCDSGNTFFNFENRFIKELYCGKSGYSLITDNVFKLKRSHSIPLAILMSRFNKQLTKTSQQWNEIFCVNLKSRDLTRFLNDAIQDINKNMEFELRLVKLDSNKNEVDGNKKFEFIKIERTDKVISEEDEEEFIIGNSIDSEIENLTFAQGASKNAFKKEASELLKTKPISEVSRLIRIASMDGYHVTTLKQLAEMIEEEDENMIDSWSYRFILEELTYEVWKKQLNKYKTRRPNIYKAIMEQSKDTDPVELLRKEAIKLRISINTIY